MPLLPFGAAPFKQTSDTTHVLKAGDTMTGTLDMQANIIILKDANGVNWSLAINTDGSLKTS